jgi:hypothetical protein
VALVRKRAIPTERPTHVGEVRHNKYKFSSYHTKHITSPICSCHADHVAPLYPQKLALTSPTRGGRSIDIVRSRTNTTELWVCEGRYFQQPCYAGNRTQNPKIKISYKLCSSVYDIFSHRFLYTARVVDCGLVYNPVSNSDYINLWLVHPVALVIITKMIADFQPTYTGA